MAGDILNPTVLVVPPSNTTVVSNLSGARVGTLVMSGAKLYICVTTGTFEKVTSA